MIRTPRLHSLQARLAVLFALLVAATLLVTGALAFHLTRTQLDRGVDAALLASLRSFEEGPARGPSGTLALRARRWLAQRSTPADSVVAVRVGRDRVLASSGGLDLSELPQTDSIVTSTGPVMEVLKTSGGDIRVLAVPLEAEGSYVGTFVAAARRDAVDETLAALARGIGWSGAGVLATAALLGLFMIRAAMQPLERITGSVAEVERTGDLSRRVSGDLSDDEVGRLGHSFDRMLDRLQRSFSSQQNFLSDAAHEIRTPLTVARGQLEWLLGSDLGSAETQSITSAIDEIDRVDRSVEDLLLLARLDEGARLVLEPVEVDLVISEAALRGTMVSGRKVSFMGGEGIRVQADPQRLRQVLDNLIGNAIKHGGDDATVELRVHTEGATVSIEVVDDGRGIPSEELERVFERHYRVRSATGSDPPGSGLGLAIAKSLTEAMGGTISARSAVGKGSTFTVQLPGTEQAI